MPRVAGSLSLIASGGVAILVRMLTVPLYLAWLGEESYSLYIYMLFLSGFVGLTNLQFEEAAVTRLTEAFARRDQERAWRIQQAFTALTWITAGVGALVFAALALFLPVPHQSVPNAWLMYVFFGLSYAMGVLGQALHPVLYAQDKFQQLAAREFFISTGGAVAGVAIVYSYRSPVALAAVTAVSATLGYAALLVLVKRLYPEFRLRPRWDPEINRDLLRVGLRGYLHRATLMVSTTIDKLLMPAAMPLRQLSHYQVPAQIPLTLQRIMDPIQNTLRPELTRRALAGGEELAATTARFARIVLGIACCTILIPAAYGGPILSVWLPRGVSMPQGPAVMFALGAACTLELFHGVFNTLGYAVGKPHVLLPVSGLNALATLTLTIPVAARFGVAGVAVQNLTLFALLLPLLVWQVRRHCASRLPMGRLMGQVALTLTVALPFALGAHAIGLSPWGVAHPLAVLASAPVAMLGCWIALRRTGLTPHIHLPGPLKRLEFSEQVPSELAA